MNQSEMIGSRLKEERLQQKLTLKQLSEKVLISNPRADDSFFSALRLSVPYPRSTCDR